MTEQQKQKIVQRLQKIKALSEQGVDGEAENAAKLLAKMLAKHRMSMEDIETTEEEDTIQKVKIENEGDRAWIRKLYGAVARYFDCRYAYASGGKDTLVGYTEDIECVKYLFVVAKRQIDASVANAKAMGEIHGRSGFNSYRHSMVSGFHSKLVELKREISEDNPGYALVLQGRKERVNNYVDEFCSWGNGRSASYRHNSTAYSRGKQIKINKGVGGGSMGRISSQRRLPGC